MDCTSRSQWFSLHTRWPLVSTTVPNSSLPENPAKRLNLFIEDLTRVVATRRGCGRPYNKATLILGAVNSLIALHPVELSPENAKAIMTSRKILETLKKDLQKVFKKTEHSHEIVRVFQNLKKKDTVGDRLFRALFNRIIFKSLNPHKELKEKKRESSISLSVYIKELKPLLKYLANVIHNEIEPVMFLNEEETIIKNILENKAQACFGPKADPLARKGWEKEHALKKTLDPDKVAHINHTTLCMNMLVIFRELSLLKYKLHNLVAFPPIEIQDDGFNDGMNFDLDKIEPPALDPLLEVYYGILNSKKYKNKVYTSEDAFDLNPESEDSSVGNEPNEDGEAPEDSLPPPAPYMDEASSVENKPGVDSEELEFVEPDVDSDSEKLEFVEPDVDPEEVILKAEEHKAPKPESCSIKKGPTDLDRLYCISKIGDAIRGSLIVDNLKQIPPLLKTVTKYVKKRGGRLYEKNLFKSPTDFGYAAMHLKMRMPVPSSRPHAKKKYLLIELQIHAREIMDGTVTCPKEMAHVIYKKKGSGSKQEAQDASKLVYLIALEKMYRAAIQEEPEVQNPSQEQVLDLLEQITQTQDPTTRLAMRAVLFSQQEQIGLVKWSDSLKAIVPQQETFTAKWLETVKKINEILIFPPVKMDKKYSWTNTARSVDELLKNAKRMGPSFKRLCERAAKSQPGCTVSFGPNNKHMMKERKSLEDKIHEDLEKMLNDKLGSHF